MLRSSTGFLTNIIILVAMSLQLGITYASSPINRNNVISKPFNHQKELESFFPSKRKACSFYVWNVASAGLHALCQQLCKDCKYEGRGGREFMLIPPGSLLQLLFPCHQYSPDSCLWCGGNHVDHATLAWSRKHLYSPFDLMLDRTTKEATTTKEIKVWKDVPADVKTTYCYHKRYVIDIDAAPEYVKRDKDDKAFYDRSQMTLTEAFGIRYLRPRFAQSHVARQIVIFQLNRLIEMQQLENAIVELKQHGQFTRQRAKRLKTQLQLMN